MQYSDFGTKLTAQSGILQLMDDLGKPLPEGVFACQLGGGNPARIPGVEAVYRREMERLLAEGDRFENAIARYDAPQGRTGFIEAAAELLRREYGWDIGPENIAITNGSQSAFFYLFNIISGTCNINGIKTKKTVLFPLVPEYIGYADQGIEPGTFVTLPSRAEYYDDHTFKYFIDFGLLETYLREHPEVGGICVSRPTNPTGNVLTDSEIHHLAQLAADYSIPLFVDNAYGLPFPDIIFPEAMARRGAPDGTDMAVSEVRATPYWDPSVVLAMSLSKIGLPSLRTGIIIADREIVRTLSAINSIVSLASGSLGQVLAEGLIRSGEILTLAARHVRPFYYRKTLEAQRYIHEFFDRRDYLLHKSEGALFNWLLINDMTISTRELYEKLKERGVITVPGEYFFFGPGGAGHPHFDKCLRLNYARPEQEIITGLHIIAEISGQYRK
ncbi:MAG: valine--pyruvate transaminase [Spirochaetaceae bacterium]|jgi:valine--pyruvate aminotransferase|nr:valine--pyruvate transaminase [Spirochaetaceae bacterium]